MGEKLTDEELGAEVCPEDPAEGLRLVAAMSPAKREAVERLIHVGRELELWEAGVGPKPTGVLVCHEHKPRRRKNKREEIRA